MNMFERSSRRVCEQDASCYGKFKIGSRIGRCTTEVHCFKNQRVTKVWSRCSFQEILILYPGKVERRLRVNGDKWIMSLGQRLVPLICTLIQKPGAVPSWDHIVITYEHVWAIVTDKAAPPEQAQEVHVADRGWLAKKIYRLRMPLRHVSYMEVRCGRL